MTFETFIDLNIGSAKTRKTHKLNIKHFKQLDETWVSNFILQKLKENSPASANSYIKTIKLYGKYKKLKWPEKLKIYSEKPIKPVILSNRQIHQICEVKTYRQLDMFWLVFAYHPFRASELIIIDKDHVNLQNRSISIGKSKTFAREMPATQKVWDIFEKYVEDCGTHLLFPSPKDPNTPVSQRFLLTDFNRRLKECGIEKRRGLYPNSFRHTSITDLLNSGAGLLYVMHMAGHKNPKTTKNYWRPDIETNRKELDKRSLIGFEKNPLEKALAYDQAITNDLILDQNFDPVKLKKAIADIYAAIR